LGACDILSVFISMWRDLKDKSRPAREKVHNNRLRLVVAIIFLLSIALVYKLFTVQIRQCDLYTAMASSQHQVYSQLKPERGKIFLSDTVKSDKLYPIATNKDFAVVYVVPKEVASSSEMAEKLYQFFDLPKLEEELKKKDPNLVTISIASSTKEEIINKYLKKLNKPDDPYEPLENKVMDSDLLRLYAFLGSSSSNTISTEELELKNGQVVYKNNPSQKLEISGLGFDLKKYRYYPEGEIGASLLGFVSYVDEEERGNYGLEEFFNEELFGKYGSVKSEKGGSNSLMIVNDREYIKPESGDNLILTIDRNIQFLACEKLKTAVKQHQASGGSLIALNPKTGAIIAMCSEPSFDPNNYKDVEDISYYNNPAVFYQYEPGSVFKPVTMSIAIDQGKITPSTTYRDEGQIMIKGWPKPIKNSDFSTHGPHGIVDMVSVLENSLNTGAIFAMSQVGPKIFSEYVRNYGFGEITGIELGSESAGNIDNLLANKVKDIDAATASFGQGVAVTPLQMIMPYQVFANGGVLMKPYVVKTIVHSNGRQEETTPKQVRRIISEKTAATISAMLVKVVESGHSKRAAIDGYYIGGKTGTAQVATAGGYSEDQYVHTFIGIAPIDQPTFVMLTKIDNPKDVEFAEGSAVPLWRDVADFILKYYGVPKTR